MKIYLSKKPTSFGGGSNTFSGLFQKWAKKKGYKVARNINKADLAIIIAHLADEKDVAVARQKGRYLIHRLDEYFEQNEDEFRRNKHEKIIQLNRYADVTIFQSRFVFNNVYPFIKPKNYRIIHNGSDPEQFYPSKEAGTYIGHATWGTDTKKRLDLLHEFIKQHPDEQFLLVGRHKESPFDFNMPNVRAIGKIRQNMMPKYFRMMKLLYFPSEKDPCPNTVVEAILSGVPVCYNSVGGTSELVKGQASNIGEKGREEGDVMRVGDELGENKVCGLPLEDVEKLLSDLEHFRANCLKRNDLHFERVFEEYMTAANEMNGRFT